MFRLNSVDATTSYAKRRRRDPRHHEAIEQLLNEDTSEKYTMEAQRFAFLKEKFAAELEFCKMTFEMEKTKLTLHQAESNHRQKEFEMEVTLRMKKLEMFTYQNQN